MTRVWHAVQHNAALGASKLRQVRNGMFGWIWPQLFEKKEQQQQQSQPQEGKSSEQVGAGGKHEPSTRPSILVHAQALDSDLPRTYRHGDDEPHMHPAHSHHRHAQHESYEESVSEHQHPHWQHHADYAPLHHGHHHSPQELAARREREFHERMERDQQLWRRERQGSEDEEERRSRRFERAHTQQHLHNPPADLRDSSLFSGVWRNVKQAAEGLQESAWRLKEHVWPSTLEEEEHQLGNRPRAAGWRGGSEEEEEERRDRHGHPPHHAAQHWNTESMKTHLHRY